MCIHMDKENTMHFLFFYKRYYRLEGVGYLFVDAVDLESASGRGI